jgi:hypothetical protein
MLRTSQLQFQNHLRRQILMQNHKPIRHRLIPYLQSLPIRHQLRELQRLH